MGLLTPAIPIFQTFRQPCEPKSYKNVGKNHSPVRNLLIFRVKYFSFEFSHVIFFESFRECIYYENLELNKKGSKKSDILREEFTKYDLYASFDRIK